MGCKVLLPFSPFLNSDKCVLHMFCHVIYVPLFCTIVWYGNETGMSMEQRQTISTRITCHLMSLYNNNINVDCVH